MSQADETQKLKKRKPANSLEEALSMIAQERIRQDAKWGSDVERIKNLAEDSDGNPRSAALYGLPLTEHAKRTEMELRARGQENFASILLEEFLESIDEAVEEHGHGYQPKTIREVTQLAAAATKWLEALLRRRDASMGENSSKERP